MAHIMAGAKAGGAELFFERIIPALASAGETVLPVIRRDSARAARLRQAGVEPVELSFGGALDLLTPLRLRQRLQRFAPNLVMAWMGRAAASTPTGDWMLVGRLGGYYDLRRFRRCNHLVANTRGLAAWIHAQGWPADRVHHLPNFSPDLLGAPPAALPVPPGTPIVLAMGRLHRNKAFDVLISAIRRLPGVHLALAGDGPEREALGRQAAAEGVTARVHFLGWRADQAELLAACTVLACPSRQEVLGNVVLEAFSAGVPVVAAASPGPMELIRPRETGLLVHIDDAEALAEAIGSLIESRPLSSRLVAAARREYESVHSQPAILAQWQGLLGKLAGEVG